MSHTADAPLAQPAPAPALAFGDFVLDIANARLLRAGVEQAISRKPFALLVELVQRPGELVSKDHLLDTVWGRRFVSDSAVKSVLSELRAALGDDARAPRWVETVQARGYRFLGAVQAAAPVPKRHEELAEPPSGEAGRVAGQLPLLQPLPIGREALLAPLMAAPLPPLLTLVGPAGVGKSLVALALAHHHRAGVPDGAWWLDLAGLPASAERPLLCAALVHTLRLADAAARDDAALAHSLQGLRLLLVLDNAEHVVDVLAPVLAAVLGRAEGVRVLVTSREALHLPLEQVHPVPPLDLPPDTGPVTARAVLDSGAGALFVARVAARQPGFVLGDAQAAPVAALCRALDGLPLALELAAARVPMLGIEGLHRELAPADDEPRFDSAPTRLRLLARSARHGQARHHTLRAALDWSHDLLPPQQQRVLRRVAVFAGPFELVDAEVVARDLADDGPGAAAPDEWAVLEALQALVERSWIGVSPGEPRRFFLLHSVRAYARQRLLDAGESRVLQARHFQAVLAQWHAAGDHALDTPALQWIQDHEHRLADLRAALVWGCDAVCTVPPPLAATELLALVGASGLVWHRAGRAGEGLQWCQRALALVAEQAAHGADALDKAGVDLTLAHLAGIAMVLPAAQGLAAARRAADLFEAAGDTLRAMYALYLEHTLMARAEPEADRAACLARLQAQVRPHWHELLRRFARHAQAYEARLHGRHAEYLAFNDEELARCRRLGATWEAWSAGIGRMLALHDVGRLHDAVAAGRAVLEEMRAAGRLRQNANRLAMWLMMLAESAEQGPVRDEARTALHDAWPVLQGAGRAGMALLAAAWLAVHEGRAELAARLLARFDAPGRTGAEFGPGTFIRRSVGGLWARLRAVLGDAALAQAAGRAEQHADAELLRELLGTPASATLAPVAVERADPS